MSPKKVVEEEEKRGYKGWPRLYIRGFSIHRVPDNAKGSQQKTTASQPITFVDEENIAFVVEHCKRK